MLSLRARRSNLIFYQSNPLRLLRRLRSARGQSRIGDGRLFQAQPLDMDLPVRRGPLLNDKRRLKVELFFEAHETAGL